MGFINDLVSLAFDITGGVDPSLVETVTYKYQSGAPSYNTTSGGVSESLTPIPSVVLIRSKLTQQEKVNLDANPDLEVRSTDRIYLCAANKLGRTPALGDKITLADSSNYEIVGIVVVPGDSLYKLITRRP